MPRPMTNMKELETFAREGKINENASIRDRQSTIINASIEYVWELLTDVPQWSSWNADLRNITAGKVEVGSTFQCTLRHTHLACTFQAVVNHSLLTWTGKGKFVKVIFVWSLEPSDQQTIITVEQSVEGLVIPILTNQSRLHDVLVDWLQKLKATAEK